MIGLLVFVSDGPAAARFDRSGVDGVVVDLETRGKRRRQNGFDTDVSSADLASLTAVREATRLPVVCRINGCGPGTPAEVAAVISAGADEVLVPMVRRTSEVELVLELVDGRAAVSVMVETEDAVVRAAQMARLPVARVYVGLNDLQIDRDAPHLFAALADGTVADVRAAVGDVPFGFAGLTLPGRGTPVPSGLLLREMAALRCSFTFLRRSFLRDLGSGDAAEAVALIRAAWQQAQVRHVAAVERDHAALTTVLAGLPAAPWEHAVAPRPPLDLSLTSWRTP